MSEATDVILIQNRTARVLGPTYGVGKAAKLLRILPGTNRIERDVWDQVSGTRYIMRMIEREELQLLDDKGELVAMTLTRAVAVVGGTVDRDLLAHWAKTETRTPVLKAVQERLELLDGSKPDVEQQVETLSLDSPMQLAGSLAGGVDTSKPRGGKRRRSS